MTWSVGAPFLLACSCPSASGCCAGPGASAGASAGRRLLQHDAAHAVPDSAAAAAAGAALEPDLAARAQRALLQLADARAYTNVGDYVTALTHDRFAWPHPRKPSHPRPKKPRIA